MSAALTGFLAWSLCGSQLLGLVDAPRGIVIAVVIGGVLGALGMARWIMACNFALLGLFFSIVLTPIMRPLSRHWIRSDELSSRPADALVVLSSGLSTDSTLDAQGMDRLLTGVGLFHEGRAPLLVTMRVSVESPSGLIASDTDQRRIIGPTTAPGRWVIVDGARTTRDEATKTARLLLPERVRTLIVVTSPMHTRRACAAFETVGFRVTCIAAHEHDIQVRIPGTGLERLSAFQQYLYERLGAWKYRRHGWII